MILSLVVTEARIIVTDGATRYIYKMASDARHSSFGDPVVELTISSSTPLDEARIAHPYMVTL